MGLHDLGAVLLIIGTITLLLVWGLGHKRSLFRSRQKDLSRGFVIRVKRAPQKIPEKLFSQMKEQGIGLVPEILRAWPELSPEKREQLWAFWELQGYIDFFIKELGAKNEERRVEAAGILMTMQNKKLIEPLLHALSAPDQYVPARVAEVLLSLGKDAVGILTRRVPDLSDEAKPLVISVLGELGDQEAVPCLLSELSHPSPQVRMAAAEALGEMGKAEILADRLIGLMNDADWGVRSRTVKALGKIGNPKAIPILNQALQDEAWWVRTNAAEALKRMNREGRRKSGEIS